MPLIVQSKALLDGSDANLTNEAAKAMHLEVAQPLVAAVQSIK